MILLHNAYKRAANLLATNGRGFMAAKFPNDFEYYAMAFELTDSNDTTQEFFQFPIMPVNYRIAPTTISNVIKTSGGVVSLTQPTFVPFEITLNGNFGLRFRLLRDRVIETKKGKLKKAVLTGDFTEFDLKVKNGYGMMKIMKSVIEKCQSLDSNNEPYRLYLYNLSFNESYLVEPKAHSYHQSMDMNRIWNYDLSLIALAPAENIRTKTYSTSMKQILKINRMNKRLDVTSNMALNQLTVFFTKGADVVQTNFFEPIRDLANSIQSRVHETGERIVNRFIN